MTDVHNQSQYVTGKCRCHICRADHAFRSNIYNKAVREAAKWVRRYRPDIFDQLLTQQYELAGIERRPVGRPPKPGPWSMTEPTIRRKRLADIPDDDIEDVA